MPAISTTPKLRAAGVAFAPSIVLVWLLGQFGVDMPPEVAAAAVGSIMWATGLLKSEGGRHARE